MYGFEFVPVVNAICFLVFFLIVNFSFCISQLNLFDVIEAFNSTSRYLDDLLNNYNPYFIQLVGQIYLTELYSIKANLFDTEAPLLD